MCWSVNNGEKSNVWRARAGACRAINKLKKILACVDSCELRYAELANAHAETGGAYSENSTLLACYTSPSVQTHTHLSFC